MSYIIPKEKIQINETACRFQGKEYGDIPVSFFWVFTPPGRGPSLHVHPYEEVFVLQQGQATFTIGGETLEVHGGEIVVAPANTPHKFRNSGEEPLQMISFHPNKEVIQEWLEEFGFIGENDLARFWRIFLGSVRTQKEIWPGDCLCGMLMANTYLSSLLPHL